MRISSTTEIVRVAPDLEQDDLARGDASTRQRPDVHIVGDQNDGLSWPETEQELPQFGGLPVGAGRVPEERVEHGRSSTGPRSRSLAVSRQRHHWLVRTRSTIAPAAPIVAPISRACSLPLTPRLRWVAQLSSVNDFEISGSGRVGVAHDGDDAGLGQAGEARVGRCRRGWEKEGRHRRGDPGGAAEAGVGAGPAHRDDREERRARIRASESEPEGGEPTKRQARARDGSGRRWSDGNRRSSIASGM